MHPILSQGGLFNILDAKLPKQSWVKISQIRTLSGESMGKKIGSVGPDELAQVIEGLNEIIGGKL